MISKSFMVTSMEFKNLCSRAGYPINNSEIVQIFKKYDKVYSNIINYMQVFNDFRKVSESRKKEIENFNNQVKAPGCSFVSFAVIESMTDMNFHPDVTHFLRALPLRAGTSGIVPYRTVRCPLGRPVVTPSGMSIPRWRLRCPSTVSPWYACRCEELRT